MNDGRSSRVQEVKAFEDLSAPRSQNFDFHHLEALQVAAWKRQQTSEILSLYKLYLTTMGAVL